AYYIIEKLKSHNFEAYLVGGGVRDLLLNERPKDFDIATSAKPEEIKDIFKRKCILIGKRFRLAHIRFGKKIFEVATFRAGDNTDSSLIIRDNEWGSPEEDALRRDFTINGLFYDAETQEIIDFVNGFPDVEKKVLRTIGNPDIRFSQDPVRMLRLLKFKARFNFTVDPKTEKALINSKESLKQSSQARIFEELMRMLESGASAPFFSLLYQNNFLQTLFPNLNEFFSHPNKIRSYLLEADIYNKKNHLQKLKRPTLIAFVLFPILDQIILSNFSEKSPPHLGIIHQEAKQLINTIFEPFFKIPKRIKAETTSILTNQYRFAPAFSQTYSRKIKIPRDPSFFLSMDFFKIRAMIDKELLPIYQKWNEAVIESHNKRKQKRQRKKEV
ncbi:MAG TPA: polynucleotide adenylyltransferase PcnB, partial [Chlamydiales bacterium]|nr:polynucleotide adenylyltransferase PcnB [Chlamydiales bacterium]